MPDDFYERLSDDDLLALALFVTAASGGEDEGDGDGVAVAAGPAAADTLAFAARSMAMPSIPRSGRRTHYDCMAHTTRMDLGLRSELAVLGLRARPPSE